jgi:hypothetical protein
MEEVNILAEAKSKSIKLSDGKEYKLPPIDMTTLANIEKTMGFGLGKFASKIENETMQTLRSLVYALLKENYPELTIEQVGRLVTLKEIGMLSQTIAEIMAISG